MARLVRGHWGTDTAEQREASLKKLAVFLLACVSAGFSQQGALLYRKHCAQCHDSAHAHAPGFTSLRAMSETALLRAMQTGTMREPAKAMTAQECQTLAAYLSAGNSKTATSTTPTRAFCKDPASPINLSTPSNWNGFGAGLANTRFQEAAGLSAADIPKLRLKWAFSLGNVTMARGQPVVVGKRLFIGTSAGQLYSLDARTGCIQWMFEAESAIRSGVVVGGVTSGGTPLVFFGDTKANAYAADAVTGKLAWKTHPEEHPAAMITGAPTFYDGAVYFGISSLEEVFGGQPKYECCTFRGSVVALNASTGATLWKTYTISDAPKPTTKGANGTQRRGPSGAGVWSAPTIDVKRNAIYVATGDNYSDPATDTSDAVLALDRSSGKLLWSRQMTANDAYNLACYAPDRSNCPDAKGPDLDFGQPPILVSLSNGKDALVIGQKSAVAWAIDPDQQGKVLWQTRVGKGGSLGGSQWGSAADRHSMYISISDLAFLPVKDPAAAGKYLLDPATGGGLFALDLLTGNKRWSAPPPSCGDRKNCSPAQPGAVSAIPGVVFLGSLDGHFRAYSSETGKVVWDFDAVREFDTVNGQKAHGGSMDGGGAAISGGIVYVNTGYDQWGEMPGNALLAFSPEDN
jgi:polyvinyl alcohol dehydrogenase (cytochrome)